jgi:predicted aminopeptidase
VVYASGDTMFNESFATAVERLGSQHWLDSEALKGNEKARQDYARFDGRRRQFRALALATRLELAAIYDRKPATEADKAAQAASKAQAFARFREDYAALKASWGGFAGYDPWVARANNAAFGAQAAYDELVPGFEALFEHEGRDWQRFYDAVKGLARLPRDERRKALDAYQTGSPGNTHNNEETSHG